MASWWNRHADWLVHFSVPAQVLIILAEAFTVVALVGIGVTMGFAFGLVFD
jgi:hypothetical protein